MRALQVDPDGRLENRTFLDDPRVTRLLAVLDCDGEEARVVGGAVRNAALGLPPGDIDIATTAVPDVVTARARAARLRPVPTGIAHGTVTVVAGGLPLEVTTLREDVETDGRHATVVFGRDFVADAHRRDFTVNALSVDRYGRVHDSVGGLADLANGVVRFIGDPATRIREDYLRILRFFRFSASYATGQLDPAGFAATVSEADGLSLLSRERVRAELLKLLAATDAVAVVAAMDKVGMAERVIGLPCHSARFGRYRSIAAASGAPPDPILGLAALALGVEGDAQALRDALRLSNEELNRLARLASCLAKVRSATKPPDAHAISALLFDQGRGSTLDALSLWQAESEAEPDDAGWQAAARFAAIAVVPTLPITGTDVMARGISKGPLVGRSLKAFQALWIRAGFPQSPAVLHDLLDQAVGSAASGTPDTR